jgi:hypothetical protein
MPTPSPAHLVLAATAGLLLAGCPGPSRPHETVFFEGMSPAEIEVAHPLTDAARAELTPDNVATLKQWEIDQLYARLASGPIPDGPWQGRFFFAEGGGPRKLSEALGGVRRGLVDAKLEHLDRIGESLWKGKVFFRSEGVLRNMIDREQALAKIFGVPVDRMHRETIDGREVALLFPARLYCGDSLYDPRRPSVIIDYADTDQIEGYLPAIDSIAGRDGLAVRDEIRRVRPGFYLGRAYSAGRMLLTFTLYNESQAAGGAGDPAEECDGSV